MRPALDVAVVGAGPAGLATAYALAEAGCSVRVLESAATVGGRMRTVREDGCLIDTGAEMFPARAGYPATWRLITELGLDADPSAVPKVRDALAVWRDGRARPHAGRPLGLLTGAGLPPRARLDLIRLQWRLARLGDPGPDGPEPIAVDPGRPEQVSSGPDHLRPSDLDPGRPERAFAGSGRSGSPPGPGRSGETLPVSATIADLVRSYHTDLRDYLVHPLVAGFFGWDPERSAAAPFAAHLTACGSSNTWHTYRDGMDTLTRALASRLDVVIGHPVTRVTHCPGGVRLESPAGATTARSAVLAVPAPVAARLYGDVPALHRRYLEACGYTPMLRVSLVLNRPMAPTGARPCFATLIPAVEDPVLGVITVDDRKHRGRAPTGRGLISLITAPRGTAELLDEPDEKVANTLIARAERFIPGLAAQVTHTHVHRFPYGLPEATPRALRLREAFSRRPAAAVEYAGDWVTLRPCSEAAVASAAQAAERVLAHLSRGRSAGRRSPDPSPRRRPAAPSPRTSK